MTINLSSTLWGAKEIASMSTDQPKQQLEVHLPALRKLRDVIGFGGEPVQKLLPLVSNKTTQFASVKYRYGKISSNQFSNLSLGVVVTATRTMRYVSYSWCSILWMTAC